MGWPEIEDVCRGGRILAMRWAKSHGSDWPLDVGVNPVVEPSHPQMKSVVVDLDANEICRGVRSDLTYDDFKHLPSVAQPKKMKMPDGLDDYGLSPRVVKDEFVEDDLSYVMKNWESIWINGVPDPTFEDYENEVASVLASNAGVVLSKTQFKKVVDRLKGGGE